MRVNLRSPNGLIVQQEDAGVASRSDQSRHPCLIGARVRFRVGPLKNTVPWSNGNDAWFTSRKRWFNSIRDYFARHNMPRYAIG